MTTKANASFAPAITLFSLHLGNQPAQEGRSSREAVLSHAAPAPIGPYSQAIRNGTMLYCSGQIPIDPKTGQLVDGTIEAQTKQVMTNIRGVLEAADLDFSAVVKTTIYLIDMADFPKVNAIYGEAFPERPPARSTVAVAALPLGARVEIEVLATYLDSCC